MKILKLFFAMALLCAGASAHADIFQWEYSNIPYPPLHKQQSTTLAPDGAGVDAVPGAALVGLHLQMAYLYGANLTNASLTSARLNDAYLYGASLVGADFTDAEVRGASFGRDAFYGGSGITLAQLYSTANYAAHDLSGIGLTGNNLSGANFSGHNLTSANLDYATLTSADFTNAEVRGAAFNRNQSLGGGGITLAQLYSTASYAAHDLSGIGLRVNDLSGANLSGFNLTRADMAGANLTNADFTNAEVRGATLGPIQFLGGGGITLAQLYSTASYAAHDLSGIVLSGHELSRANLSGVNLTGANLSYANWTDADLSRANLTGATLAHAELTGANFTNAEVRGTDFYRGDGNGIALAQLYSTASYAAHDLSGIRLSGNNLSGADFSGLNLTGASLDADLTGTNFTNAELIGAIWGFAYLTGANFTNANLTGANLHIAELTGANFTNAQVRGANFNPNPEWGGSGITLTQLYSTASYKDGDLRGILGIDLADTDNIILPSGRIDGLDLAADARLVVRDYADDSLAFPITVDQHLTMSPGGTLRMVFEADAWGSTISFAPGIPVTLGGTLELALAAGVDPGSQVGRTFDLFDWNGVDPTGAFSVSGPFVWDLSNLYTTGEVTLAGVPEPESRVLLMFTVAGWCLLRRRTA